MPDSNRIIVVGIGGMGGNVLNHLISASNIPSVNLLHVDTDAQALEHSRVQFKMLIGEHTLKGLGTGKDAAKGKAAAEDGEDIWCPYADTVFLIAGLGGGTGSGAIQVYAKKLLSFGKEVVCIVSTPFHFEDKETVKPSLVAQEAMNELDRLGVQKIVFNNQDLFKVANENVTFAEAFRRVDENIAEIIRKSLECEASDVTDNASGTQSSALRKLINRFRTASSTIWGSYLSPAMVIKLIGCVALVALLLLYQNLWAVITYVLYIILGFSPLIVLFIAYPVLDKFGVSIPKRCSDLLAWLIWPMIIGMFLWLPSHDYFREAYRPFGLSINDTLLDYKLASNADRADWDWRVTSYPNTLCMSPRAKSCGHWVSDETREKFSNCVSYAMQGADSSKKLGDVCKECLIKPTFRNPDSDKRC
jgi:hypothetical protein